MEYKNIYLYIPRQKILNYSSRKHHNKKFKKLYYYVNKKQFKFNENIINEIDIFNIKEIQKDTFYKDCFNSNNNEIFDVYYKLKSKYNNLNEIYIKQEKPRIQNNIFGKKNENNTMNIINEYVIDNKYNKDIIKRYNNNIRIQRDKLNDKYIRKDSRYNNNDNNNNNPLFIKF